MPRPRGRKSLRDEAVQANVINLSWTTISRALVSKKISEKEKRMISLEIVKKTAPKEINLKGDIVKNNVYAIIGALQRDSGSGQAIQADRCPSLELAVGNSLDE